MESVETTGNLSQAAPAKGAGGSIKGHASGGTSTTTAITTTTKNDDSSSSSSDKKTDKPATSLDDGSASDTNTPSTPVTTAQALDTAADGDGPSLAKDSNIDGETVVDESSRSQTPITNNSEERIGKEVEKGKLRALKEKAMADYEAHAQKQRFQRLNFLLERSSLYASFLTEKMERQRQEQRERDERERQQQQQQQQAELSNEDELNTQGASKKRRLGRPRKGAASKQATGGADEEYDELDGNREDGQRRLKHRRIARDNEKYKLSDYIDPETMTTRDKESKAGQQSQQQQQQQQSKGTVKRSHRQPKTLTGGIMRDYQIEGMEWLVSLYENGLNGILADEMGLGKTIQTISFLTYLRERDVWGPFLIVCPLSTVANWVSEFMRFVPTTPVLLYHGTPQERAYLRQKHLKKLNKSFPVVVTSYELVMNDRKYLQRFAWKYIVVDEGHRIKNLNCKLIRELKSYRSANRLLLTGTPLQNNLAELWSLLNFLLPDIFDDLDSFQSWFDFDDIHQKDGQSRILSEENKSHIISKLHHILQPFLLRRLKADVEHHLPKKREYVISCPMTVEQRQFYKATVDNNLVDFIRKRMLADSLRASGNDGKDSLSVDDVLDGCDDDDDGSDSDHSEGGLPQFDIGWKTEQAKPKPQGKAHALDRLQREAAAFTRSIQRPPDTPPRSSAAAEESSSRASRRSSQRQRSPMVNASYRIPGEHEVDAKDLEKLQVAGQSGSLAKARLCWDWDSASAAQKVERALGSKALKSRLMQLRKVCNHPYLLDFPLVDPNDPESPYLIDEHIVRASGKLLVLDRLLPYLMANGHRILIFSQMTRVLDIIQFYFERRDWDFCRLEGSMPQEDRQENIRRFNSDTKIKLFLLTTRAGGVGINLASADTVILFDSDWNPQMDLQAQDRAHRIGQTKPVIVYRLVMDSTVEGKILERANAKRKLEKLVIHRARFKGVHSSGAAGGTSNPFGGGQPKGLSLAELVEILASDDGKGINKTQAHVAEVISKLRTDEPVPKDLILTDEELRLLDDRSDEAYAKAERERKAQEGTELETANHEDVTLKNMPCTLLKSSSSKIRHMETVADEQNDALASIKH